MKAFCYTFKFLLRKQRFFKKNKINCFTNELMSGKNLVVSLVDNTNVLQTAGPHSRHHSGAFMSIQCSVCELSLYYGVYEILSYNLGICSMQKDKSSHIYKNTYPYICNSKWRVHFSSCSTNFLW